MGIFYGDRFLRTLTPNIRTAMSRPDVVEVKNRTLDGQWHVQTIGDGATVLDVETTFTMEQKIIFDDLKKKMVPIKIIFDGFYYEGVVEGVPGYQRTKYTTGPMFSVSFVLLVNNEGVVM